MRLKSILVCLLFLPGIAGAVSSPLAGHFSPYLAMHADDPVRWRLWDDAVLQQARRENKLIFISSGYFACHWCHVMQRESFRNETIAALLNRVTIPVKVDRELDPELDAALIAFVERTRGSASWPLNVFLTPEGYPLVGTVYLPPDGFQTFLERLALRWQQEPQMLVGLARRASQQEVKHLSEANRIPLPQLREKLRQGFSQSIEQKGDFLAGGLGDGAKFPEAPLMEALLLQAQSDEALRDFTALTLEQIAGQGLRDHLGGGFFRYTVDPGWQQPHFEKMLYDNAQLARLFLHASETLAIPAYRALALQTLDFMLREMWHKEGAFIASLSALDEAGVEGGYYLWTQEELQAVLGEQDYRLLNLGWSFCGAPDWQGAVLPVPTLSADALAERLERTATEITQQLRRARQALLRERRQRSLPRDEKRLAGWNGLALSALSEAGRMGRRYRLAGKAVRDYLHSLWDGERLWRLHARGDKGGIPGVLEDYIYVAQGLLDWAAVEGDRASRELAARLVDEAWQRFHGKRGWHWGEGEAVRLFSPAVPMLADGALPSPSALWLQLKRRLGQEAPVEATLLADTEVVLEEPLAYPSYLLVLERSVD